MPSELWLRIAGIEPESIVDGPGFRYVIFAQGCPHHCPGCHNPQTHDFEGGSLVAPEALIPEILQNPLLQGVTFSGGEPFCQAAAFAHLARMLREQAPRKDIMIYSGFTLEQLQKKSETDAAIRELLALGDWLVDGPFILAQRDLSLRFRGSSNQRIINLAAYRAGQRDFLWSAEA